MAGTRTRFLCGSCGSETLRWEGRCPTCGAWNSLEEAPVRSGPGSGRSGRAGRGGGAPGPRPEALRALAARSEVRLASGMPELDRVLGGGLVAGSLVLLGGAPGIGKSTLLLQLAARLQEGGRGVLYASGEESAAQVGLRAMRLGEGAPEVPFLAESRVEVLLERARETSPALLCVDSVQTLRSEGREAEAGGVVQVRHSAAQLGDFARTTGTATLLVGHVTKGGGLAGPRTLEHMVDAVLLFEGRRTWEHRILRAVKNRFGGVDEIAVLRMTPRGLEPVPDPSALFLEDRPAGVSGSAVAVPLHGSRPLLAEVQALAAPSRFGPPRRVTTGLPSRRLAMLLAVLERRAGLSWGDRDVFVNVVGGLRLSDPAADLAVTAALASAHLDLALPGDVAFAGEVGLGGEIRGVERVEGRAREALRSGMRRLALPETTAAGVREGLEPVGVPTVGRLVEWIRREASGVSATPADRSGTGM